MSLPVVLILVGTILAGVALVKSRLTSILAWAVVGIGVGLLLPRIG